MLSEMDRLYRNVFSSAEGQRVLGDILTQGHFGVTLDGDNRDQIAEYNFALVIGTRAGVLEQLYRQLGITKENDDGSTVL
jgi:hypothetical protein